MKMRWEKVESGTGEGPGKRLGHSCNAVIGGKFLFVFGGFSGNDNCLTNQVHVFDSLTQTWSQLVILIGQPPTPRESHSCTNDGDGNLYVFGGSDGTNPLNDLHILITGATNMWIHPIARGEVPEAREGHGAAFVGKKLFIFGGCGKSADNTKAVNYNDLYILDTVTFFWTHAKTSGTPPCPRVSHTCSSWKNKIVVIGGEDEHDSYLSDVHILDTDSLIWRELRTSGQRLPPRAGHSTVSVGKNLYVFGGFTYGQNLYNDLYMLDIDTGKWTKEVATTSNAPCARFFVAGDCLHLDMGDVLVFFGGFNISLGALDDMYYLYTGILRESQLRLEKFSFSKILKLSRHEQIPNPLQNQVQFGYVVGADSSQPSRLNIHPSHSLPFSGKISFQAKVTESIPDGYIIETTIDGKRFQGILFQNKPNPLNPAATNTSSRKMIAGETVSVVSNDMRPDNLRVSKVLKQSGTEDRREVQGDVADVIPSNPITAGANDMTRFEGEVQIDDQTDLPISNNEAAPRPESVGQKSDVPKPAAAEGGVTEDGLHNSKDSAQRTRKFIQFF